MDNQDVALVQSSFAQVQADDDTVAGLFYGRLFELDPTLKLLFKGDLREQGRKLMLMLRTVVNGLNNVAAIQPAAEALARRHVAYGVKDEHYQTVGAALLWTLEKGLGPAFTSEVKAAWMRAYGALSGMMIAAAH
jgi:nitric oxide dioxygenase